MNPNLDRWIYASICQHFTSRITSVPVCIEGARNLLADRKQSIEIRCDGPYYTELSKDYWRAYIEVNLLIQSAKVNNDMYAIRRLTGMVVGAFTQCITVYKYGSDAVIDDGSVVDVFIRMDGTSDREKIQVSHFGQVEPTVQLEQATVEAHYEMFYKL